MGGRETKEDGVEGEDEMLDGWMEGMDGVTRGRIVDAACVQ